jgi:hypothetical protein
MKAARGDAVVDGAAAEAEFQQLPTRDRSTLRSGQFRGRFVTWSVLTMTISVKTDHVWHLASVAGGM